MHRARQFMVRRLLLAAASISALSMLFRMGYSHPFDHIVSVALPPEDYHALPRYLF